MSASNYSAARSLPANIDAERSILGGLLLDPNSYDEVAALGLIASEFLLDSHRRIYSRMVDLAESSRPIDQITLIEELERHKELATVGDVGYVSSLLDGVPDRPSLKHYVKIVREKADQRKTMHACNAAIGALDDGSSSREVIGDLGERLLQIQTGSDDAPAERVLKFSDAAYSEWERLADSSSDVVGLTTGIECVDLSTTGIRPGETWALGGRTGDGKTSLALQIAAANCRRDIAVGYFSIEMTKGELLQRLWSHEGSHEGRILFQHIRNPRLAGPDIKAQVSRAMGTVGLWPLFVAEDGSLTLQKLVAKARLLIRQERVQLLIIDYVQLVSAVAANERERITKISGQIRALAKDTGVPIIAVSQLTRPNNKSLNERPNKFSLKESGSLENDASTILLVYRPTDDSGRPNGKDEIVIAKQRHGPVSNEKVLFDSSTMTFFERRNV
ncbi:MAG: replicative DNA helicase [Acidobacteriota bacterium]|nr:replicative DNA helicase [Acidobacteriota bacterium]